MKDILLVCDYGVTRVDKCTLSLSLLFFPLSLPPTHPPTLSYAHTKKIHNQRQSTGKTKHSHNWF